MKWHKLLFFKTLHQLRLSVPQHNDEHNLHAILFKPKLNKFN